ncbi:hypothetical protein K7X08_013022 [Anisodus acutangulus]|uniref:Uncharacterized protein n=1 Tax=Anisodus acutangulus TaxID=402998 RepID=A0A9Q1MB12_9SOLA|nr:hypothetical protein K7X08_013022 [Anisodus acutangulus]
MVGLDDLLSASIKGPSFSIKGNRQEFGRNAISKRDISALPAVGLHDCCTPLSIDPLSSSSDAHNLFDEIAKRNRRVAMLELVLDIVPFDTWMNLSLKFEIFGIASSLFDEMPDNSGAYMYSLISENVVAQHRLLHFPFDPGSSDGLVLDNVELVFYNSFWLDLSCIAPVSTLEFGDNPMVPIIYQLFDTMSHRLYCSKFWGDSSWTMVLVGHRLGSFVAIDFSVEYLRKSLYMLVLTDVCVSVNGKPNVFVVIRLDIAGLCCVGLNSRPDHNVFILERHLQLRVLILINTNLIMNDFEKLDLTINNDLNSKLHQVFNVDPLVLPSSSSKKLFGVYLVGYGYIIWFEKQKEESVLEVALGNEAFEEFLWVVNSDKEEHINTVVSV